MITTMTTQVFEFRGLTKDLEARSFPVQQKYIANGSTFHAMDEDQLYIYDESNDEWVEYSGSGGGAVKINKPGEVTGLAKTIKSGNKIYAIQGTTQTGMIEYFYNPKKDTEPFLNTKIGQFTTIQQKSVVPTGLFDLFEQIFDEHGTVAYVTSVDNDNGTVTVRTMTTGASINDDIIVTEQVGDLKPGDNLNGMSPADIVVAITAPTKIEDTTTSYGGTSNGVTSLNRGETATITTVTPTYTSGGQGDIVSVKVESVKGSTTTTVYETPAGSTSVYTSGTPITLTTPVSLDGSTDTTLVVSMTTKGNESVNPSTKVENIVFKYDGRDYYAINKSETSVPAHSNWINIEGEQFEVTVTDDQVIWLMLPDQTRHLEQYAMGTWMTCDWYYISYNPVYNVYVSNTGALWGGTYKFRLA